MFDHKLKTQEGHSEIVDCTGKLHDEQNTKKIKEKKNRNYSQNLPAILHTISPFPLL